MSKQTTKNSICDKEQTDNIIWGYNEFIVIMIPNINTLYGENTRIIQLNIGHSYCNHCAWKG
jgi:hypothetical protein